jgi:translation elongation factor EF-1alpha
VTEIKEELIGKTIHYYPKVEVAMIKLSGTLEIGDTVRIVGGKHKSTDFEQEVESIRLDDKPINTANADDLIGLRVPKKVPKNSKVYKIT